MVLKEISHNLWIHDGETVSFLGLPYSTRMTVIKLEQNRLWIYSPTALVPELKAAIDNLGEVSYLITPNKLHYLFLPQWAAAYPQAMRKNK